MKNINDNIDVVKIDEAIQNLGIAQGAVLTYAPSIYKLVVDDPFND